MNKNVVTGLLLTGLLGFGGFDVSGAPDPGIQSVLASIDLATSPSAGCTDGIVEVEVTDRTLVKFGKPPRSPAFIGQTITHSAIEGGFGGSHQDGPGSTVCLSVRSSALAAINAAENDLR